MCWPALPHIPSAGPTSVAVEPVDAHGPRPGRLSVANPSIVFTIARVARMLGEEIGGGMSNRSVAH
jgi:hypothetical protein